MISYIIVPFNIERLISHFLLVIYPIIIFSGKYDFSLIENKSSSHELSLWMIVSVEEAPVVTSIVSVTSVI